MLKGIKDFVGNHKILVSVILVIGILFYMVSGYVATQQEEKRIAEAEATRLAIEAANAAGTQNSNDALIIQQQSMLIERYGNLPEGYLWDLSGELLSIGDPDMTAEEVVYAYLNSLTILDISTAQRYSRGSSVVNRYSGYFDITDKNTDYQDQLVRRIYQNSLKSIQIKGVKNDSVFAENKRVFTIEVSMLDLTTKDFWLSDMEEIFRNLMIYRSEENDSTKAEIYLYDYIMDYYTNGTPSMKTVIFDITLQRFPDLNSGWLVCIDTDIDSACRYADGKLVVSYIQEKFNDEGREYLEALNNPEQGEEQP